MEICIDQKELTEKVGSIAYDVLFGTNRKYRHAIEAMAGQTKIVVSHHDFAFNTLVDDRTIGKQKEEFGIRVISVKWRLP